MKNKMIKYKFQALFILAFFCGLSFADEAPKSLFGDPVMDDIYANFVEDVGARKENGETFSADYEEEFWSKVPPKNLTAFQRRQIESGVAKMAHQDTSGIWSFRSHPGEVWVTSDPKPFISRTLDLSNLASPKEVLLFSKIMPEPFSEEVLLTVKKAFSASSDDAVKLQLAVLLYRYGNLEGRNYLQARVEKSLLAAEVLARGGEKLSISTVELLAKAAPSHTRGNCFIYALGKNPSNAAEQVLWQNLVRSNLLQARTYLGALVLRPRKMTPEHLRHLIARVKVGRESSTQLE